jgi:hypothetical protein
MDFANEWRAHRAVGIYESLASASRGVYPNGTKLGAESRGMSLRSNGLSPGGAAVNSQGRKPLEMRQNDPKPCKGDTNRVPPFQGWGPDLTGTRGLCPWLLTFAPLGA